jgi:feruloyl esterase
MEVISMIKRHIGFFCCFFAVSMSVLVVGGCASQTGFDSEPPKIAATHTPQAQASDLVNLEIPASSFNLPVKGGKVISATLKTKSGLGSAYLEVFGYIYPVDSAAQNIEFKIALPDRWNGRAVQKGTGGDAGSIPPVEHASDFSSVVPLDRGYVVFADDSGHQYVSGPTGTFAANNEMLENWLNGHMLKAYDAMQVIVKAYYGRKPDYVFYAGNSNGGREALVCATKFGKYYDAIFCGEPSANFMLLRLWGAILSTTTYKGSDKVNGATSHGFISDPDCRSIQAEALARYDEYDGIKDGIVSNVYKARMDAIDNFLPQLITRYSFTQDNTWWWHDL